MGNRLCSAAAAIWGGAAASAPSSSSSSSAALSRRRKVVDTADGDAGDEHHEEEEERQGEGNKRRKDCGMLLPQAHASESIWGIASAGPSLFATGSEDKAVVVVEWEGERESGNGGVMQSWRDAHTAAVNRVAAANGVVVSGGRDATVRMHRLGEAECVHTFTGHELVVSGLAISPDAKVVCSGSRDTTVRMWDAETGAQLACARVESNVVTYCRWIPGEQCFLQAGEDLRLRVWDARSMEVVQTLKGHTYIPLCCDVSNDANYFASCSNGFDGEGCEARVLDRRVLKQVLELKGHTQSTNACCFADGARGRMLVTGSTDRTVRVWEASTSGRCLHVETLSGEVGAVTSVCALQAAESANNKNTKRMRGPIIAAATFAGAVKVWGLKNSGWSGTSMQLLRYTPLTSSGNSASDHIDPIYTENVQYTFGKHHAQ